jgi:shikimate dehydrogenase
MLEDCRVAVDGKKVLVLGSGGASSTAQAVLRNRGARVVVISRSGENNYENITLHADARVIVNATPVGMYPNVGISPVDLNLFPNLEAVLDVVYNPRRTRVLLDAEKSGLITGNGLLMLVAQAKESSEWFQSTSLPDTCIDPILRSLEQRMHNIILIGMPGCGKSLIGRALAEETGLTFLDADTAIEELAGKTIPEIFKSGGEAAFRALETQVLADLGKGSGQVIATGGGCVTREENYAHLHQNGNIFWLKRDLNLLPAEGRPLSQITAMDTMYRVRKSMYESFADYIIDNNGSLSDTVSGILAIWEGNA